MGEWDVAGRRGFTVHKMRDAATYERCRFAGSSKLGSGKKGSVKITVPADAGAGQKYYYASKVGRDCRKGLTITVQDEEDPVVASPPACDESLKGANDADYRGCQTRTRSGKLCQRWDSQTPHIHNRTPENYPNSGLDENYCRNPDGEPTIWCYTNEANTRWEFCDPVSESTTDDCGCVGKTNHFGEGGAGCDSFHADSAEQWCYTRANACQDGKQSKTLIGYEWSFVACQ